MSAHLWHIKCAISEVPVAEGVVPSAWHADHINELGESAVA